MKEQDAVRAGGHAGLASKGSRPVPCGAGTRGFGAATIAGQ